jgi:AraC-like DNA-binding protein
MTRKVIITAADTAVWQKLEAIEKIDPSISGGIESVMQDHRLQPRGTSINMLFSAGFEEVHEIEPGFCAHITDAIIDKDWRVTGSSVDYTLRFRIVFAGEAGYVARGARASDESTRCTFIVRPPGDSLTANFKGSSGYRYCALSMTRQYLRDTLKLSDDDMPSMLTTYWARHETVMGHFPTSKSSLAQASRFFNIRLSPAWHDLTVKTLAFDLLRMLFHDWQSSRAGARGSIRITPSERAKLIKARELIVEAPAAGLTLATLCQKVRMNRNKLHWGFKQQFGVSVHECQTELRLQLALTLLRTTDLPISEIAERTGYGEPTNFTAAFKKHFAALPREVRASAKASQS